MAQYIILRGFRALMTLLAIVTVAFVVLRLSGDSALSILGIDASSEAIANFRARWGLDQPLWVQYFKYLRAVAVGDLGISMLDGRPAVAVVLEKVPVTLAITVPAFILKILIGVSGGIYSALNRNSWVDRAIMTMAVFGFTIPSFVLGLCLIMLFSVSLHWLPSGGAATWASAILPIVVLAAYGSATIARFTRSAMIEVLGQPFVRAAVVKGLPWPQVIVTHVLPNAVIPIITIIGFMIGSLVAGAVVVESVFSWPGIGRLLVSAVANRDLAVVQVILLLIGLTMVGANLLVDLAYGWIDPRLRRKVPTGRHG